MSPMQSPTCGTGWSVRATIQGSVKVPVLSPMRISSKICRVDSASRPIQRTWYPAGHAMSGRAARAAAQKVSRAAGVGRAGPSGR